MREKVIERATIFTRVGDERRGEKHVDLCRCGAFLIGVST